MYMYMYMYMYICMYMGARWPNGLALGLSALWSEFNPSGKWEPMIITESAFYKQFSDHASVVSLGYYGFLQLTKL